ncbi:MAG: Sensor histidine kinase [Bacteroidetes bacterium]|nr:MAG: Sensor histidine kinase [Bacteroidota bacterium]
MLVRMCASTAGFAQELSYRNFQVKDGLPSSEVYCAIQDRLGYMWFSTDAGICRFDGYSFRTFTTNDGLTDNTVFQLFEDRHGRIWCRTLSGRVCYYDAGKFVTIPAADSLVHFAGSQIATSMHVDANDTLWIGLDYKGIVKVAPGYTKNDIRLVSTDAHVSLVLLEDKFVYALEKKIMVNKPEQFDYKILTGNKPRCVLRIDYPENINFIRTASLGNDRWLMSQGQHLYEIKNGVITSQYLCPVSVIGIYCDSSDNVWVGLYDGGLLRFPGRRIANCIPDHYFGSDPISCIIKDHEGGLWLTSVKNGVYYLSNTAVVNYAEYGRVSDNKIYSLAKVNNEIWAGNNNGTIWRINEKGMRVLDFPTINQNKDNALLALHWSGGTVLAGARRTFVTDTSGNKLSLVTREDQPALVKYFALPGNGKIYAGTFSELYAVDEKEYILRNRITFNESRIICCYAGLGDTLWMGCVNGLWFYSGGVFQYAGSADSLLTHRIDHIASADGKTLYIATKDAGVLIWDRKNVRRISKTDGLASDFCRYILLDGNQFWVATNKGVSQITEKNGGWSIRNIGIDDGLVSNEVNQLCLMNGKLWIATSRGVSAFDTTTTFYNAVPPPVYISSVTIFGKEQAVNISPVLPHDDNTIEIRFTGLAFRNAGKVSYRYRLIGLDSNWRITQTPEVRFTTLPPGDYEFHVCALNNDNVPSTIPARWKFSIAPPFWNTWWFILVCAVSVFLLGGGIVYIRARGQQKRELEKAMLNQQVTEMEMKALRAQMNPHFIFNAITSIQHFVLRNDSKQANKYLTKFSKLIRNVLENSEHDTIHLKQEVDTLTLYVEIESLRFSSKFDYTIDIDPALYNAPVMVPAMLIQPFVENAIWHGLLPRHSDGRLLITIKRTDDYIHCLVDDDGIGRPASALLKKETGDHKSFGMNITRERIDALNRVHLKKTELKITDKTDPEGKPAGTLVELFIPIFV